MRSGFNLIIKLTVLIQAVIILGQGKKLSPLTDRKEKAFLPVGNAPMISHCLRWIEEANLKGYSL